MPIRRVRIGAHRDRHGRVIPDFRDILEELLAAEVRFWFRIDIPTSVSRVTFDAAWSERIEAEVEGVPVPIIGRQAFVQTSARTDARMTLRISSR